MNQSRRSFLASLPAVAAAPVAATAKPAKPTKPYNADIPHDAASAAHTDCDCPDCYAEYAAVRSRPDFAAAVIALYKARDALLTLWVSHGRHDRDECEVCYDAYLMADALVWIESSMEGEFLGKWTTPHGRRLALQLEESDRLRTRLYKGEVPPLPPPRSHNDPAQEPAVLALLDARDALEKMAEDHPHGGLAGDAETGGYLCRMFGDLLQAHMVPTDATMARD